MAEIMSRRPEWNRKRSEALRERKMHCVPTLSNGLRCSVRVLCALLFIAGLAAAQSANESCPIGVFDSGTGGLVVLEQILKMDDFNNQDHSRMETGDGLPDFERERFVFLADQANMPYGNYPAVGKEPYLRELIETDARFLLTRLRNLEKPQVKALVIACNTATAYGKSDIEALVAKAGFDVPVIGIIDAGALGAIESLGSRRPATIGVLATEGTVASGAYVRAIRAAALAHGQPSDVPVVQQAALGLAGAVDGIREYILQNATSDHRRDDYQGPSLTHSQFPISSPLLPRYQFDFCSHGMLWSGEQSAPTALQVNSVDNYVSYHLVSLLEQVRAELKGRPLTTLVLGCTHYPYLTDSIRVQLERLYNYRENGKYVYRPYMVKDVQIVDPATYASRELYGRLLSKELLAKCASGPNEPARGEFYMTVPRRGQPGVGLDSGGEFTYQYKYGRMPGQPFSDVKVVALSRERLSSETARRLARQTPTVWSLISNSQTDDSSPTVRELVEARNGLVVSVSPPGSDAGIAVLRQGGNAVDAAVAVAFALAVTWPAAGNIGGGGFMMVYPGPGREPTCVEYRETAPRAAIATALADYSGKEGHKVVGVPGTPAGLGLAHRTFGRLPWRDVVHPALRLAQEGFPVDKALANSLNGILKSAAGFAELQRVFAPPPGRQTWQAQDRLVQPDLARTLKVIADQGPEAFYRDVLAEQFVAEIVAGGGLITNDDLAAYQAKLRSPVHGTYRGYDIYAAPPPSGGGTCLVLMLNILENFSLGSPATLSPDSKTPAWTAADMHLIIEAMRRAYCDRARYLGDPDFTTIPAWLTSKDYAKRLAAQFDPRRATRSEDLAAEIPLANESSDTTHFSVIDADGMAVANTYTLQNSYGSRVVVRGGGYLLNNEMTDFNRIPGHTDRIGLIGTPPNLIAPGKRMLSSQTPTLVLQNGKLRMITGSPGGRTITNTVLCVLLNAIDRNLDIRRAVDAPRLHHQWFPDRVSFEGLNDSAYRGELDALRRMGHTLADRPTSQGDAHSIWIDPCTGHYFGAADQRLDGKAAGY